MSKPHPIELPVTGWKQRCACDSEADGSWLRSDDPKVVAQRPQTSPQVALQAKWIEPSEQAAGERPRPAVPPPRPQHGPVFSA